MSVIISDEILQKTRMTGQEVKMELAALLYQKQKLTLAQAGRLAEMGRIQFQHLLKSRNIPIHFTVDDLDADVKTLQELDRV